VRSPHKAIYDQVTTDATDPTVLDQSKESARLGCSRLVPSLPKSLSEHGGELPSFTGSKVELEDQRKFLALFSSSDLDRDAEYHVIFARGIDSHAAAITKLNFTLVKSDVLARPFHPECTFAHEFVHFLSEESPGPHHDGLKSELMFDSPAEGRGIMMHRQRILRTRFSH